MSLKERKRLVAGSQPHTVSCNGVDPFDVHVMSVCLVQWKWLGGGSAAPRERERRSRMREAKNSLFSHLGTLNLVPEKVPTSKSGIVSSFESDSPTDRL